MLEWAAALDRSFLAHGRMTVAAAESLSAVNLPWRGRFAVVESAGSADFDDVIVAAVGKDSVGWLDLEHLKIHS